MTIIEIVAIENGLTESETHIENKFIENVDINKELWLCKGVVDLVSVRCEVPLFLSFNGKYEL